MQKFIILCLIALLFGCAKDKNMDDLRRDQLQEKTERINSVSGAYSGAVISEIDGSNLGNIQLKFKASTDIQSSSGNVSNTQNVKVSGTLSLKSLSNADVSFDNGTYDDVTGAFQAIIAVADINGAAIAKISLGGNISGDRWTGSLEVNGQPESGAVLNLVKNAPQSNSPAIEVGRGRLEQIKKLDFLYNGFYMLDSVKYPLELSFTSEDIEPSPAMTLYKLLSPVRSVDLKLNFSIFNLSFSNASLDDKNGTLIGRDPLNQQGHLVKSNLFCKRFTDGESFGWDCEIQTPAALLRSHLVARK